MIPRVHIAGLADEAECGCGLGAKAGYWKEGGDQAREDERPPPRGMGGRGGHESMNMKNCRRRATLTRFVVTLALGGCGGGVGGEPTAPAEGDLGIAIVSGDAQRGAVGTSLPEFLVVQVSVGGVGPAEDVLVEWSVLEGGGALSLKGPRTDRQGLAAAVLFLGDQPGEQVIRAALESGDEVHFTAHALNPGPLFDHGH